MIDLPSLLGAFNFAKTTPEGVIAICLELPILFANNVAEKPAGNLKPALSCAFAVQAIIKMESNRKFCIFFIFKVYIAS